jgi:glycosyltransferase involved in cell wall biosynthesis
VAKTPTVFYTYVPRNWHASFYYRIFVPFHTARDLGLPIRVHVDTNDAGISAEARVRAFCEADIIYLYQPVGDPTYQNAKMAKGFLPAKRDGSWKYPPTVVVDTDDNLFNVSPHNIAFRSLGYRDHEGEDLPIGHTIGMVEDGERKILWKDGEENFDIARNRQTVQTYRNLINLADAVTCSTPHVAESTRVDADPQRVEVFPNMVRFDHYEQLQLAEDPTRLTILWQGGASHYEDWYPLRHELRAITKKYPHVHWKIWGQLYPWITDFIPAERYTFVDWCPYQEYKLRLVMMGHDINLAPLSDTRFNRCRSAIKVYESSVLRNPAASVAQRTGPYADEMVDGETAMLFSTPEEFTEKLSTLIENETLRKTIGKNSKDWVSQNRDAFKLVPKQFAFLEQLREQAKTVTPHMPEADWDEYEARVKAETESAEKEQPQEA